MANHYNLVDPAPPVTGNIYSKTNTVIDFNWCLRFFEKKGKELFGQKFHIDPVDHDVIYQLLIYFLGLEAEATSLGLDLSRGILLSGPVGCGKSSWLSLMRLVPPAARVYTIRSCREISFEFIQEGYEVIHRYSKMSFNAHHPVSYCFDDLGVEQHLKYYGNECNIMGEILLSRYDLSVSTGMITHITTNLSAGELEQVYGNRIRSRMRQMFNLLAFPNHSPDKRS